MILHQELFQKLVDKIIADIGYNINIIDKEGYIVASGSTERIGAFHEIGYEAATKEKRIDIDVANESRYSGVKAGINQPFYYKGNLAGIIGITGNSKEISEFVKVVKSMIEIMVEQELLKEKMYYRQSNKSYFANLLLNIKTEDDRMTLLRWAKKLGYDFKAPRTVILVAFDGKYNDKAYGDILLRLKHLDEHTQDDFSAMLGSDQLLILKKQTENQPGFDSLKYSDELVAYGEKLVEAIGQLGIPHVYVGIGSLNNKVEKQVDGYNEAAFCIDQLKKSKKNEKVGSIYDYLLEYASSFLPDSFFEHFIMDYYEELNRHEGLLETVVALSLNHMNLVDTAKSLYVHRNTVVFRVNKLKELTGLDPTHHHKDRIMCHLIAGYYLSKEKGSIRQ